jgi:beta-lactamase class A
MYQPNDKNILKNNLNLYAFSINFEAMKHIFLLTCFAFFYIGNAQTDSLRNQIQRYLKPYKATVGISIKHLENGDTISINNHIHFPMQSVYKFHLALAIMQQVDSGKFLLDQKIALTKKNLVKNTYSPLRDKYPQGNVSVSLKEILFYTLAHSDNNGCDILFNLIGGPAKVNNYIHQLGFNNISIQTTEAEMHKKAALQYDNWTTPQAATELLETFYTKNILSKPSFDFMLETMLNCQTGKNRIRGKLAETTLVAHKTGSSGTDKKGISAATNDIGIITLPNGQHFAITVLVGNSCENDETNALVIAEVSKIAFDFFNH